MISVEPNSFGLEDTHLEQKLMGSWVQRVLNQVPHGGATLLIFLEKRMLSSVALWQSSLINR